MSDRIASYATMTHLTLQALRLQASYAATQTQQSSGLKSEYMRGIAADSKRLLNLQAQFSAIGTQAASVATAQQRITAAQSAMDGMQQVLTTVLGHLAQAQSGGNENATAAITSAQAAAWRDELAALLNSAYGGSYLFAGSAKDTAPVDFAAGGYDPAADPAMPDTRYYTGDGLTDAVRASAQLRVEYGVTADHPAFEKALRALTLVAANPADTDIMQQAYTLIRDASSGVADISGILTARADILARESEMHTATLDYLDNAITDLRSVDMAQATLQLTQLEAQLEASYSTLGRLLNLKLTDYL